MSHRKTRIPKHDSVNATIAKMRPKLGVCLITATRSSGGTLLGQASALGRQVEQGREQAELRVAQDDLLERVVAVQFTSTRPRRIGPWASWGLKSVAPAWAAQAAQKRKTSGSRAGRRRAR